MSEYAQSQLYKIRHSSAHILAQAVIEFFSPEPVQIAIGPPIENGFYYDFGLPRSLTPDDLKEIEKRMRKIIGGKPFEFSRRVVSAETARQVFADQVFKLELIDGLEKGGLDENGEPLAGAPVITLYDQPGFTDLCRGPHVASSKEINPKAVSLMSIAGAYWRGDENRPMLQRIYGTAFEKPEELEHYLWQLEEARKRDHRKLGKELGLFHFAEDVGPGIPLFTPKGEQLRYQMEKYVRDLQTKYGYDHVWTGNLVKEDLYRRSGHLENYADAMFPVMEDAEKGVRFRLKPMNCPSHMTLFREMGRHSYRELPMRFAEFATLYRYEKSGELSGLTRVRSLTQDDCHIFCTPSQIEQEFSLALQLITEVLTRYRLSDYKVRLSLRGEGGKYVNDPEKWDLAEAALRTALQANGIEYFEASGEAAFYGPKADFMAKDALGREWQLSTIQVDFIQPARLGLTYVGEDGQEHTPVVLHRAVTGSTERFLGVIIEHFAGNFPVWLAPVQAVLVPITDRHVEYCQQIAQALKASGMRAWVDDSNDRMNAKIRTATKQKVPYILVVGDKEAEAGTLAVRTRSGEDIGTLSVADFLAHAQSEIASGV
ncbi:MAG TPA: threonine--tRNA ligase [Anaerolineales bacterium]|nr:threonine--tRNA ligase [Anaerolineales bacterium]